VDENERFLIVIIRRFGVFSWGSRGEFIHLSKMWNAAAIRFSDWLGAAQADPTAGPSNDSDFINPGSTE
jgi:hypothetical protein